MSDVAKTPREELECKKKYLYEHSMFWECNDGFKSQILEDDVVDLLNEQQELIEELQVSDEMGWKRAEMFEKKCPKELHNKKMYIKRLEYKVQKFKEENEQLKNKLNVTWDEGTVLNTEQIVRILNAQNEYIDYVTKERNLACNKLDNYKEKVWELEKENDTLRMITGKELFKEIDNLKKDIQQLEKENAEAHYLNLLANGFIIEKGLAKEFLKWSKEND